MNSTLRNVIKFLLVGTIVLMFSATAFLAGFGSAYLLAGRGVLPMWSVTAPADTQSPVPSEEIGKETSITPIPAPTPTNETEETFQLFWEVWDLVQRNFYGKLPDMQEMTYAAIRGMLDTLDDEYTAFMEPSIATILAEDATGEFEGIGAFVDMDEDGKLEIVQTFEGGPAEKAGILAGDRVLEVDSVSIVGSTLYEAIGLIRGPAGSEVTLLVEREGVSESFEVTVTRACLEIPIIEVEMRDDGVGYIRLHEFSATASERVEEGLEELLAQEPRGIVFDLRRNPGGWLDQAVQVADLFLNDGVILIERWSDGDKRTFEAGPGDIGEDIPLVVLVNGSSASASEIVAGALQDRERAILVGEATFGKGSVQRPFTLSDGSELRVTIALWFTPNDRAIHGQGLAPDIQVPWPEEGDPDVDPQLERAVEYLLTGE
ncbi:MAG: S41 family peptidase [Anaerolineae bacterium]|nr:S41 family peptidase [Anaerolineae bacterium]